MDFVVGMRVHKSNNHPTEDICDVLAGDYPKAFIRTDFVLVRQNSYSQRINNRARLQLQ
ncbi:MAG: hypothetical protein II314_02375 [Prevotella sp.]|nr:hypothetical protein [Prevotella sp.]